ncbi:MAG TPA: hypothetical protein PKY82_26255 [Pyrinomonadaceae bacterium]|nr:hypothetical protein [Pyrinomonadaceae bacterium]
MAYPIGAEAISKAFVDLPQFEQLNIWFTTTNFAFASDFQEARKQNKSYEIFRVSMIHPLKSLASSKQFIEEGFYNEKWEIHVYPVPREVKSFAKQFLINEILPKAKEWMETPRTEIWRTGRKHFRALFKENEPQIFIEQD